MRLIPLKTRDKIKDSVKAPAGLPHVVHYVYQVALPVLIFVLMRLQIALWLPILLIVLSKWRVFAVRPRFWPANLRANSIDIMVGISIVAFMDHVSASLALQVLWAVIYGVWLLAIKPRSSIFYVSLQAAIGQLFGLTALFIISGQQLTDAGIFNWTSLPLGVMIIAGGLICYLAARHFFDSFNEPYTKMLSYIWGYFAAALVWVLGHMLVVYPGQDGVVAMPTLMLCAIGYSLGSIYYLEHFDRLSLLMKRELLFLCGSIVLVLLVSLFYAGSHLIV